MQDAQDHGPQSTRLEAPNRFKLLPRVPRSRMLWELSTVQAGRGWLNGTSLSWKKISLRPMPRVTASAARRFARRVSRSRPTRQGTSTLDIRRLISPLRYDVHVRMQFFMWLRNRETSVSALQAEARHHNYYQWFKHVECARFFPSVLSDPQLLAEKYDARVARAVSTLESFDARGFDLDYPVTLVSTQDRWADSGAAVSQGLHIADGCHRLARLLMDGKQLRPDMYRVRRSFGSILDNTTLLLPHIDIAAEDYARFMSHGFVDEEYAELEMVRNRVATAAPDRMAEFDQVVRLHRQARLRPS